MTFDPDSNATVATQTQQITVVQKSGSFNLENAAEAWHMASEAGDLGLNSVIDGLAPLIGAIDISAEAASFDVALVVGMVAGFATGGEGTMTIVNGNATAEWDFNNSVATGVVTYNNGAKADITATALGAFETITYPDKTVVTNEQDVNNPAGTTIITNPDGSVVVEDFNGDNAIETEGPGGVLLAGPPGPYPPGQSNPYSIPVFYVDGNGNPADGPTLPQPNPENPSGDNSAAGDDPLALPPLPDDNSWDYVKDPTVNDATLPSIKIDSGELAFADSVAQENLRDFQSAGQAGDFTIL